MEGQRAAYLCCLYRWPVLRVPANFNVKFSGNKELNQIVRQDGSLDPSKSITLEDATTWFTRYLG